ncbi:MAG: amino acid ABC transporter substrate-binding protein [Chloroflexi bacterium]|nr:amino acid ABC transporter substrate-binding protein [Chloroflexota bacterium]
MSSRSRLAAILVVAAFVGGACSGTTAPTSAPVSAGPSSTAAASATPGASATAALTGLLAKVKADGKLIVGTSNDAPLSYVDSTKGPSGALTDILVEFLKRQGISATIDMVTTPFGSLIPGLQSGQIEIIGDAMYIRPARAQVIDFTMTTFYNPEALDVVKGNPKNIHQLADLCGKSAGTYIGTTYVDTLKAASAKCTGGTTIDIKQYPKIENVFADLSAGRIDAGVVDASLSAYALTQNPSLNFQIVSDYIPESKSTSNCAFGIAKGDQAFLDAFNSTYTQMLSDGTVAAIFTKWGLTPTDFFLKP